jgi:hypothetical protein
VAIGRSTFRMIYRITSERAPAKMPGIGRVETEPT